MRILLVWQTFVTTLPEQTISYHDDGYVRKLT